MSLTKLQNFIDVHCKIQYSKVASVPTEKPPYLTTCTNRAFLHMIHAGDVNDMVECEECEEWFSPKYMELTQAPEEDELWYCRKCGL